MEPIDKKNIDKLRAYETSYQEGAWEDFERFRKKKKKRPIVIFWRMAAGIAISAIIGWGAFKIIKSDTEQLSNKQPDKVKPETEKPKTHGNDTQIVHKSNSNIKESITKKHSREQHVIFRNDGDKTIIDIKETNREAGSVVEEKRFRPELLESHTFAGVLVRPKTPFMAPFGNDEPKEAEEKKNHPFKLSIAVAGSSNQAENVLAQQNFGLRGTTEIALGRKTEFSTGVYFGRENLNIQNTITPVSGGAGIPMLNQANYRWLNLEIPLNIRYHIWQKGPLAFSTQAGISIMGALSQTTQMHYENRRTVVTVSVGENGEVQEISTTVIDKEVRTNMANAQRLSLGTALNFSFGVHYPIGKNQISIEPFFKYPIGAFTSERLHYSSVGMQLRWTITATRKAH